MTDEDIKIMYVSNITGLSQEFIAEAFNNSPENISDSEKLVNAIIKRNKISEHDNNIESMCDFVFDVSLLSKRFLVFLGANKPEFYNNITLIDALTIILSRMLKDNNNNVPCSNGFPASFNFTKGQENNILKLSNGKSWYPCLNTGSLNFGRVCTNLLNRLNVAESSGYKLLYHGTSWLNAGDIMRRIKTTTRGVCSDFGMNNFYTTDVFYTACEWAIKNSQAAVVVLAIPDELFFQMNIKNLSDTNEWRSVVFMLRNEPKVMLSTNYDEEIEFYENLVEEIDKYDMVEGPIMSNPGAKSVHEVEMMRNNDRRIPYQFSFKKSYVDNLNQFILTTVFFSQID